MGGTIEAVIYDFSGVLTSSPWPLLSESAKGDLELLVGPYHEDTDHPWHRLERGEITIGDWMTAVLELAEASGGEVDFSAMESLLSTITVHAHVLDHIRALKAEGFRTALITNNVREGSSQWRAMLPVDELFEVVVDSSEVGMRKPNPAIYAHTLALMGDLDPGRAVFLDDVESNLVGARIAGLQTIFVPDPPDPALVELDTLLGRTS
jgi:epoxide hydrolase-like predicted phosphatase